MTYVLVTAILFLVTAVSQTAVRAQEKHMPSGSAEMSGYAAPPQRYYTIRVRLWPSTDITEGLRTICGDQSRDFDSQIRLAAAAGQIRPYPGRYDFTVELIGMRFDRLRGKTIYLTAPTPSGVARIEQSLPERFGEFSFRAGSNNRLKIAVWNGEGHIALPMPAGLDDPENWVDPIDSAIRVYPDPILHIAYPATDWSLQTCARWTAGTAVGQCGCHMVAGERAELYRLMYENPDTAAGFDIHFVVR